MILLHEIEGDIHCVNGVLGSSLNNTRYVRTARHHGLRRLYGRVLHLAG